MGRKSLTLVSCKYLHNRRLEISSQTGRESVISMLFSVLCVYMLQYPSLCTKAIHYRRGSSRTCVCVFCFFFCVFLGGGLSAFLLVPMYGCLCLCMWMHVHPGSLI